jgi:hypothetical protein
MFETFIDDVFSSLGDTSHWMQYGMAEFRGLSVRTGILDRGVFLHHAFTPFSIHDTSLLHALVQ